MLIVYEERKKVIGGQWWKEPGAFSVNSHLGFVLFGFYKYYLCRNNNNKDLISKIKF